MAAQTSPLSQLDSLREALTRTNRTLKPQQLSRAAKSHPPSARVASHKDKSEKTYSETGDDPADKSYEDGN